MSTPLEGREQLESKIDVAMASQLGIREKSAFLRIIADPHSFPYRPEDAENFFREFQPELTSHPTFVGSKQKINEATLLLEKERGLRSLFLTIRTLVIRAQLTETGPGRFDEALYVVEVPDDDDREPEVSLRLHRRFTSHKVKIAIHPQLYSALTHEIDDILARARAMQKPI